MRMIISVLAAVGTMAGSVAGPPAFTVRVLTPPSAAFDALIVGHAACSARVWVLTDAPRLVTISVAARTVTSHALQGLGTEDRPWGLACTAPDELWTLANPHTLARLDGLGRVVERLPLALPRIALFSMGGDLLFQQLPLAVNAPALTVGSPRSPTDVRSWAGLVARRGSSREEELARNLVNCGLGARGYIPCWFPEESALTISNGKDGRILSIPELKQPSFDQKSPVWDAALVDGSLAWVLAKRSAAGSGRPGADRLFRATSAAAPQPVGLGVAARVILEATAQLCVLLSVRGELVEVRAQ